MKWRSGLVTIAAGLVLAMPLSVSAAPTALLLFGGKDHKTFLGCLNCSSQSAESVCNKYGQVGSKYNSDSIWNPYGNFGSKYNSDSPWNKYMTPEVVIVDQQGGYYGRFSINPYATDRTTIASVVAFLQDAAELDDLDAIRNRLCGPN